MDGDGDRDASDALKALQAALALVKCPVWLCDVTGDGARTVADALTILRSALSLPVELRCAPPGTTTTSTTTTTTTTTTTPPPNIVLIVTDDQTAASVAKMPLVHGLLTAEGTTFNRFYASLAICAPSRATIFTGQYPHNHGIMDNPGRTYGGYVRWNGTDREQSTVATWLRRAGYRTALIGTYINGYEGTAIPPGWARWYGISGLADFYSYTLNEDGVLHTYGARAEDYETDVIRDKALRQIDRWAGSQPFFLYLAPFAPHTPAIPAVRHLSLFRGAFAPRSPSFNEADVSDKPEWIRMLPLLTDDEISYCDELYRRKLASLQAVDEMVAAIVQRLDERGVLDNTYVMFTSDNGFHIGQHRLPPDKGRAYIEDVRVPFIVRGPGVPRGATVQHLALNNDIAPTLADIAGVAPPAFVDGRSLTDVWSGAAAPAYAWRQSFYSSVFKFYRSMRTRNSLYTEWEDGERELFDSSADPYELQSLHATADAALLADLSARMTRIEACAGAECAAAEDDR